MLDPVFGPPAFAAQRLDPLAVEVDTALGGAKDLIGRKVIRDYSQGR